MDGSTQALSVDEQRLQAYAGKVLGDIAGAFAVLLSYIGDETGIYRKLRELGPTTCRALATAANVDERYLREWLSAQAAGGYVTYHAADDTFSLTPEQAIVLAQEGHPACMIGFMQAVVAQYATYDKAIEVFRTGVGRLWGEHHACCFTATDRFFRPGYAANLVTSWLPALDGVVAKLERGAKVADIGCGHGSSTTLMARSFPKSTFVGSDFHAASIEAAQEKAAAEGVTANTRFTTERVKDMTESDFDLACLFDALHDMGDPVGAARRIRECLKPDGTLLLVEPLAGDKLEDNLHVLGQVFYSASTLVCTPASRAQEVGLALGAQAGEKRLTAVLREAGFTRIRRATQTDTNMVIEARP